MIFDDRVYGEIEVTEPVLLELVASEPLQRLKGIDQHGFHVREHTQKSKIFDRLCKQKHKRGKVSRYDHSVGVMLLIRLLGGSVEEQIAGLLHDVPHTAFSHVIDFAFPSKDNAQEFHEKFYRRIIFESEIPDILTKYGFETERVIDHHLFGLLERDSPNLCADRLDYTFRDALQFFGEKVRGRVMRFVNTLMIVRLEGDDYFQIVCADGSLAIDLANLYLDLNQKYWAGAECIGIFHYLSLAIKSAMNAGDIQEEDLFLNDEELYLKLQNSSDLNVVEALAHLTASFQMEFCESSEKGAIESLAKCRYIDPLAWDGKQIFCASDVDAQLTLRIEQEKKRFMDGLYVRCVNY